MLMDRKRTPSSNLDVTHATAQVRKAKKTKASIIFNHSTHRLIKAICATEGIFISDLIEELAYKYLKEKGKV